MRPDEYPPDWNPGELLNLRRYTDCTYVATRLLEDPLEDKSNCKWFSNPFEAQEFISWWYASGMTRDDRFKPKENLIGIREISCPTEEQGRAQVAPRAVGVTRPRNGSRQSRKVG